MKKIKKRYIIETLFFITIVALSLSVFLPAKRALENQIMEVKELVIGKIENDYGVRINYSSIYPSFFKKIVIRDTSIYNSKNGEKLAYFSVIHLEYRFWELLRRNPISIFSRIRIYDGDINFNTIKNKNIVNKLQSDEPASIELESDKGYLNDTIKKIEDSLEDLKNEMLPLEVSLRNIVIRYSQKTATSKLSISDGKLNLDSEKADFNLNSKLFHNDEQVIDAGANLNISGSFYRSRFSAFSLLNFSDMNIGNVGIKNISVFMSYMDNVISINTLQDAYPIDIIGTWDIRNEKANVDIDCKDFFPFSIVSGGLNNLDDLQKISVSGKFFLDFINRDNFSWKSNIDLNIPKIELAAIKYKNTDVKIDVNGNNKLLSLNSLNINGDDAKLFGKGSYKIKDMLPKLNLDVKKMRLPSGNTLAGNLRVDSNRNKIFAYIPSLRIGTARIKKINAVLNNKTKKSDFYISARDRSGIIKVDGSWIHPETKSEKKTLGKADLGYLECQGSIDSISMNNILDIVASILPKGLDLPKIVENFIVPVKATSKFYLSSDFDKVSYNVVQMILASDEEGGFYSVFSIDGNKSSFNIGIDTLSFSKFNVSGFLNSGFENNSLIFDSLLTVNDISYKTNGMYSDNMLSIYGDYGLNINIMNENGFEGSVKAKEVPIPFLNLLASVDTSFQYKTKKNWNISCNQMKFEVINSDLAKSNNNFEFEIAGVAKPSQLFLHSVRVGKRKVQLFGTASMNLQPSNEKDTKIYLANISLSDLDKKENFSFNSLITVSDKIYFDGKSKFENISFNRFFSHQKERNKVDADLVFLGEKDSLAVKLDVNNLNYRLNSEDLIVKSTLMADEKQVILSDTSVNYGTHNINNVEAAITPEEKSGKLSFGYTSASGEGNIKGDFALDFNSNSSSEEVDSAGNIISKVQAMISKYTVDMTLDNWAMGQKVGEEPVLASFIKEPNYMALYAGKNDSSYAFMTDKGVLTVHIDESLPVHLNIDGFLRDDEVSLTCSNIFADVPTVMSFIPETDIIKFDKGSLSGDVEISGTKKEPEFNGALAVNGLYGNSPKYTPDDYGPVDIPIELEGTKLRVPHTLIKGKEGALWAEVDSEFIGWIPMDTEIRCGTINKLGLLETKNLAYHAKGNVDCKIKMNIQPNKMMLEGYANFDDGYFAVPFSELYKIGEKYSDSDGSFKFQMVLDLNLGKKTEFRYPSENFPILSANIYTQEPLVLKVAMDGVPFEITGSAKIRTGELFYVKRNFHIREGDIYIMKTPLGTMEPFISLVGEIRDRTPEGEPLTITLTAKDQYLDVNRFSPQITSNPPMSDTETMMLLGQAFTGGSDRSNILKETLINTSDIFAQMGLVKKAERGIRDFLKIDVFSVRTLLLQNVVFGNLFNISKGDDLTIGNYFDNTSVYMGKYFGSAIYADASLHLSYYDPLLQKNGGKKTVYGNLLFQPELGLEMNTPFFLLRWHIAPSRPDSIFVSDTGLTLSWKYSY